MKINEIKVVPVDFPLINKFRTAAGEKSLTRNVLVVLMTSDGIRGYGEASSSLAMPEADQATMTKILGLASSSVLKTSWSDWKEASDFLTQKFPGNPTAISALECALLDASCRERSDSLASYFGANNKKIETYYTIPALSPEQSFKLAARISKKGFRKFKIKVTGVDFQSDFERICLVKECAGDGPMIVDANQGWSKETCLKYLEKALSRGCKIDFVEQPVPRKDIKSLKFIKKRAPVPIAVDESIRTISDADVILQEDAADIFNIKIAKTGLSGSLKMAETVRKYKKNLMIGCMMESCAGIATSVHWACGSGFFKYCDLDSFLLISKNSQKGVLPGFKALGPFIAVDRRLAGSGTSITGTLGARLHVLTEKFGL